MKKKLEQEESENKDYYCHYLFDFWKILLVDIEIDIEIVFVGDCNFVVLVVLVVVVGEVVFSVLFDDDIVVVLAHKVLVQQY